MLTEMPRVGGSPFHNRRASEFSVSCMDAEPLSPVGWRAPLVSAPGEIGMRACFATALVAVGVMMAVGSVTAEAGTFAGEHTEAAGTRSFRGYVPTGYDPATPLPLVVALHGCGQTADQFKQLTRFDQLAEARKFVVVYPEQSRDANFLGCWNWFVDAHMHRGAGEPSIIAGITAWTQRRYAIDPQRIYLAGLSAGGAMASVMGATYPNLYAAIGVASGCEYAAGAPCAGYRSADPEQAGLLAQRAMGPYARPLPAVVFQGDQDTTVPPVNAEQLVRQLQVTADWADDGAANGSVPRSATKTFLARGSGRTATVASYADGRGRELVQRWLVRGMGHAWSGGCSCAAYADAGGPDATRAMYDFFISHPMPQLPEGAAPLARRDRAAVRITSVRRRGKRKLLIAGAVSPRRAARVTIRVRANRRTVARRVTQSRRGRWRATVRVPPGRTLTLRASTRATRDLRSATATRRLSASRR
jgi:poly(hydroxyalkanoate) depolymerase family esterase